MGAARAGGRLPLARPGGAARREPQRLGASQGLQGLDLEESDRMGGPGAAAALLARRSSEERRGREEVREASWGGDLARRALGPGQRGLRGGRWGSLPREGKRPGLRSPGDGEEAARPGAPGRALGRRK